MYNFDVWLMAKAAQEEMWTIGAKTGDISIKIAAVHLKANRIHRIGGHDDVAEIKWKAKMNGPTQERSMIQRGISQLDTKQKVSCSRVSCRHN